MSDALAKVWARRIHAGTRTLSEVQERYGDEGVEQVQEAYYLLYGERIEVE